MNRIVFFEDRYCKQKCGKIIVINDCKNKKPFMRFESENNIHLDQYSVENKLLTSQTGKQCDWFCFVQNNKAGYFIELKGSDFNEACDQILFSIQELLKKDNSLKQYPINARIILNRITTHQITTPHKRNLEKFVNNHNGDLKYKTKILEERI